MGLGFRRTPPNDNSILLVTLLLTQDPSPWFFNGDTLEASRGRGLDRPLSLCLLSLDSTLGIWSADGGETTCCSQSHPAQWACAAALSCAGTGP